jgi:hypothetical protein
VMKWNGPEMLTSWDSFHEIRSFSHHIAKAIFSSRSRVGSELVARRLAIYQSPNCLTMSNTSTARIQATRHRIPVPW